MLGTLEAFCVTRHERTKCDERTVERRTYRVPGFIRWFAAMFTSSLPVVIEDNEHAIPEEVSPTLRHRTLHHHLQHLPAKHTELSTITFSISLPNTQNSPPSPSASPCQTHGTLHHHLQHLPAKHTELSTITFSISLPNTQNSPPPPSASPCQTHGTLHHHLQHLSAKHTVIFSLFDQLRVDIFDQEEYGVHDRLHIDPVWDLLLSMA